MQAVCQKEKTIFLLKSPLLKYVLPKGR
jgi:hypothetical protein